MLPAVIHYNAVIKCKIFAVEQGLHNIIVIYWKVDGISDQWFEDDVIRNCHDI